MTNPTPPPDRDDAWAKAGSQFNVGTLPKDAININVQGKRVAGPVKGFGALWQKTYTARFAGTKPDPKTVIREWRAHFGDFWPKGNRFFTEGSRVDPGAVAVLNLSPAPGATVVTGIMVLFADDEQFTFLTPEGHMFGGMITFTARVDDETSDTIAEIQALIRANDPFIELTMALGGHHAENKHWEKTLSNLARHFGATATPTTKEVCVDRRLRWSEAGNIFSSSLIRSMLYMPVLLARKLFGPRVKATESKI